MCTCFKTNYIIYHVCANLEEDICDWYKENVLVDPDVKKNVGNSDLQI